MQGDDIAKRVERLEIIARSVQSNVPPHDRTDFHKRVEDDVATRGILGAAIVKVPSEYYGLTLQQRAQLLGTVPERLCKTLVLENTAVTGQASSAQQDGASGALARSKYVAVVLQYTHKLNIEQLQRCMRDAAVTVGDCACACGPAAGPPVKLAYAEGATELMGFPFNGITVFGSRCGVPIILARSALQSARQPLALSTTLGGAGGTSASGRASANGGWAYRPSFLWLGGGEPNLKLRIPAGQLASLSFVCSCTEERASEGDDDSY